MLSAEQLGASLYVPTTHGDLSAILDGRKPLGARSLIFCTEDAVNENDLPEALARLKAALAQTPNQVSGVLRFIRVRNLAVARKVQAMPGVEKVDGFVIPKATRHNIRDYVRVLDRPEHCLMPTLETREVFCDKEVRLLRAVLTEPAIQSRILAIRIGGNDLLALLGVRRPQHATIYQTPVGPVISRLVTALRPYGFQVTSPVFEHIDRTEVLAREVAEDMIHGLVGKTAIHPAQVPLIESHYRVPEEDVATARLILSEGCPAVFKHNGSMCEVATHRSWAERTLERYRTFGGLAA